MLAHELEIEVAHNPDLHIRQFETLGVDDARELSAFASLTGTGGKKLFIIAAEALTREAQNALLKTLEEPAAGTYFGILVPRGALIATMRSRLIEMKLSAHERSASDAAAFLAAAPAARSKLIAKLVEDKEKFGARELLDSLEEALRPDMKKRPVRAALEEISRMRGYLTGPSPSVKMVLEHLALVLPQTRT